MTLDALRIACLIWLVHCLGGVPAEVIAHLI